ncbi:M20 family metallopeptidase [Planctomicrobium sp. SH661]|uniref:M20 family metallopeptidase n=1 Tax=Planctomicrobium sp. SH661 TaxID=3448124 RepID=UPI003F5BAD7E
MSTVLEYAGELIEFDSVSSKSNVPVTECVQGWLKQLGFEVERVDYVDPEGIPKANVIGKLGSGTGGMAFFGHTDVVPATNWKFTEHGPFTPTLKESRLYGRGSTDMKGPIACMLAAVSQVRSRKLRAPIYLCCTADEEVGMAGALHVQTRSQLFREIVAGQSKSIVGEPTRLEVVHGHKGGCGVRITSKGIAAHSSTRNGINANWKMIPFLVEMQKLYEELETDPRWRNNDFDPPTMTMNLGISDHNAAMNITAARSVCTIYYRAMPKMDTDPILRRIETTAKSLGLEFELKFRARPFYRHPDSPFVQECLEFSQRNEPRTVAYGTDAAHFHELQNCIVMGPGDIAQAHTHDEWVQLADLDLGTTTYGRMLERWCLL